MSLPIGLQLYTVRTKLAEDFEGTLQTVADIGYRNVEFAGLYDRSPAEVKSICDKLGLTAVSSHTPIDALKADLQSQIDAAKTLGYKYIVVPFLPDALRNKAGYEQVAADMNAAGAKLAEQGLYLCYHNHSFEFLPNEDRSRGMDILFDTTDAKHVGSELDVYWVQHGRDNPLDWMDKLKGRVPLLHIKDMADTPDRGFAEVGTGTVDIEGVVAKGPGVGAEYLLVEQDAGWINDDPIASVRLSFENLTRITGG